MEIQELQEQLNVLTNEYNTFKKTNENIFNLKKDFKNKIVLLEQKIFKKIEQSKPKFPIDNLNLDWFANFFRDDDRKITDEHISNYLEKYDQDLTPIKGFLVTVESDAYGAVNDGDYYDVSITVTDADDVYTWYVEDETCMAVGFNFGDLKLS